MRIRLRAPQLQGPQSRGPRLIPLLPDLRLCHLEGRNGIGKTLAARLLEIATGAQPFASTPAAWRTLREQLGTVEILVDRLADGLELRFSLDATKWPTQPQELTDTTRGQVWRNEDPASFAEVRELLRIARVGGEETLRQTVANELALREIRAQRLVTALRPRLDAWDTTLDELVRLTMGLSPADLVRLTASADQARSLSAAAEQSAAASLANATTAKQVAKALHAAHVLVEEHEVLARRIREGQKRIRALVRDLEATDMELARASAAIASGKKKQELLAAAERRRRGRHTRLGNSELAERSALRRVGITERPTEPQRRRMVTQASSQLELVRNRLQELDTTGPLQRLITQLETPLSSAAPHIGGQIILPEPPLTVDSVLLGIRRRREQLIGQPRPGEVDELRQRSQYLGQRIQDLASLSSLVADTDRKRELLAESDAEISGLLTDVRTDHVRRYQAARDAQAQLHDKIAEEQFAVRDAESRLADLLEQAAISTTVTQAVNEEQLDFTGVTRALANSLARLSASDSPEVTALIANLAVLNEPARSASDLDYWSDTTSAADRLVTLCDQALSEAQAASNTARERLEEAITQLTTFRFRLRQALVTLRDSRWNQLHPGLDALTRSFAQIDFCALVEQMPEPTQISLSSETSVTNPERTATQICARTAAVADAVGEAGSSLSRAADAALTYLQQLSESLQPRGTTTALPAAGVLAGADAMRTWVEVELTTLFNSAELRDELFDRANTVQFSLDEYTLRWRGEDGVWRRRPLEAFSSGEQAFAYTRAKLEALRVQTARSQHVLIILDEFGAFVARDRLSHLMRFVEQEALNNFAEQAVVMLPLSRDYTEVLPQPNDDGPDPTAPESEQVAKWGYFCTDALAVKR
jgi:hypothetical protein